MSLAQQFIIEELRKELEIVKEKLTATQEAGLHSANLAEAANIRYQQFYSKYQQVLREVEDNKTANLPSVTQAFIKGQQDYKRQIELTLDNLIKDMNAFRDKFANTEIVIDDNGAPKIPQNYFQLWDEFNKMTYAMVGILSHLST